MLFAFLHKTLLVSLETSAGGLRKLQSLVADAVCGGFVVGCVVGCVVGVIGRSRAH